MPNPRFASFATVALGQTAQGHTSTFLNGGYVCQEPGNSMERETAVKAELIATYGPVTLFDRIVGGDGRVVVSYRTVG